jgi:hypothetical protein
MTSFLRQHRPLISPSEIELKENKLRCMLRVDVLAKKDGKKKDVTFLSHLVAIDLMNAKVCILEMENDIIAQELLMFNKTGWIVQKILGVWTKLKPLQDPTEETTTLYPCSSCLTHVSRQMFSKTQWKLGVTKRKCMVCVDQHLQKKMKDSVVRGEGEEENPKLSLELFFPRSEEENNINEIDCAAIVDKNRDACHADDCPSMHVLFCLCGKLHFISKRLNSGLNEFRKLFGENSGMHGQNVAEINAEYQKVFQDYQDCPKGDEARHHREALTMTMVEMLNSFKNGFVDLFESEEAEKKMNYLRYTMAISQSTEILMMTLRKIKEYAALKEEEEEQPGMENIKKWNNIQDFVSTSLSNT